MSVEEALGILEREMQFYRDLGYSALSVLVDVGSEKLEVVGRSGVIYQLETRVIWHSWKQGPVRVVVAVHGGGVPSVAPVRREFIKAPD